jgi:predicted HTH transcriptional regulator
MTPENKTKILSLINAFQLSEAFTALDKLNLQNPDYAKLKREFIFGIKTVDFIDRLIVLVNNIDSPLSEYDRYKEVLEKVKANRLALTSEPLKGKNVEHLEKETLHHLFNTYKTKEHFEKYNINAKQLSVREQLVALSLAENGHIYKGTFLCLAKILELPTVYRMASETLFTTYKDLERLEPEIVENVNGNLLQQFEKIMQLLKRNLFLFRDVHTSSDDYEIPELVLRELISNAFIHRSYETDIISSIQIELFPDRLEIKSPGLFPFDIREIDRIQNSQLVNPIIAYIFFLSEIIERRGTGILRSKQTLAKKGLPPPLFEEFREQKITKVTIFRKNRIYI